MLECVTQADEDDKLYTSGLRLGYYLDDSNLFNKNLIKLNAFTLYLEYSITHLESLIILLLL